MWLDFLCFIAGWVSYATFNFWHIARNRPKPRRAVTPRHLPDYPFDLSDFTAPGEDHSE